MEQDSQATNFYMACPLCEESILQCKCATLQNIESDSSCTINSIDETPLCCNCGGFTRECLCETPPIWNNHQEEKISRSVRGSPVRGVNYSQIRRNLFSSIPSIYLTVCERRGGGTRGIFEVYNIKIIHECRLKVGETRVIKSNAVVFQTPTEKVGFLAVVNSNSNYWLFNQSSSFFCLKEGVLPTGFNGIVSVSIVNVSRKCVVLRPGTNVGSIHFNRFI